MAGNYFDQFDTEGAGQSNYFDQFDTPAKGLRPRSALAEIGTGLKAGVVGDLPQQAGQALQWASDPNGNAVSQAVYGLGKDIADSATVRLARPENTLRPTEHGAVVNALAEGAKMIAPSVAAPAAVGLGLAALPEGAVGGALGLGISSLAGSIPMGMAQAQQTYENVKGAGGTDEAAKAAGWKSGAIEAGGETLGTYVGGKFLGLAGKTLGKAVAPTVAGTIEGATDSSILKPFAKELVKTALTEVGTEIGQSYGEAKVEQNAGVKVDPIEQAKAVIGPTLGMTALLAPLGLRANYKGAQQAQAVDTVLSDPAAAKPEERKAVVDALYVSAQESKVPDAKQWYDGALQDVTDGKPIRRESAPTADPVQDAAKAELIKNVTGKDAVVTGDTVSLDNDKGIVTAPVEEVAKAVAAGKDLNEFAATPAPATSQTAPSDEELRSGLGLPPTRQEQTDPAGDIHDHILGKTDSVRGVDLYTRTFLKKLNESTELTDAEKGVAGRAVVEKANARKLELEQRDQQKLSDLPPEVSLVNVGQTQAKRTYAVKKAAEANPLSPEQAATLSDPVDLGGGVQYAVNEAGEVAHRAVVARPRKGGPTYSAWTIMPQEANNGRIEIPGDQGAGAVERPAGSAGPEPTAAPVQNGEVAAGVLPPAQGTNPQTPDAVAPQGAVNANELVSPTQPQSAGQTKEEIQQAAHEVDKSITYQGTDATGLHYFTPSEGPSKGSTFGVEGVPTKEAIGAALANSQAGYTQTQGANNGEEKGQGRQGLLNEGAQAPETPVGESQTSQAEKKREFEVDGWPKASATKSNMLAAINEARTQLPEPQPREGFTGAETIVWPKQRTSNGDKFYPLPGQFALVSHKNSSGWQLYHRYEQEGNPKSEGPRFDTLPEAKRYAEYHLLGKTTADGELTFKGKGKNYTYTVPNSAYALDRLEQQVKNSTGVKFSENATRTEQGTETAQVETELKSFLSRGFDNLVRRGKLAIVKSVDSLPPSISQFLKMVAWHGTPHTVDKFSSDKIGTGEGAQAYGHGLYFAGRREVAEWYRKQLTSGMRNADSLMSNPLAHAYSMAENSGRDVAIEIIRGNLGRYSEETKPHWEETLKYLESGEYKNYEPSKGNLYQVELAPKEDEYLLWDKPLSEQSEKVKKFLRNIGRFFPQDGDEQTRARVLHLDNVMHENQDRVTGKTIYNELGSRDVLGDKAASEYLHSLGIRGIKYLDGSSRNRSLKDIKRAFLKELPEDADFDEVTALIGTGKFTTEQDNVLTALAADDWLGFDYPSQAISAALSNDLRNYDASPELTAAVAELAKDQTFNYVIFNDQDVTITALFSKDGSIAGAYDPSTGKVYLVADNIKQGDAEYVMRHEAVHALLREDKQFVKQHDKVLSDFEALAKTEQSVQDAFAQADRAGAPKEVRTEEALAYWVQEKANHQHSLFKRIISAIKAALFRLGIAPGRFTTSDLTAIFSQGTKAWARNAGEVQQNTEQVLFSKLGDAFKTTQDNILKGASILANPKSALYNKLIEHADKWLAVTPISHLAQTFGKKITQIANIDKLSNKMKSVQTKLVDDFYALHQTTAKIAEKENGVKGFNQAMLVSTFNQMTPWKDALSQDWVPAGRGTDATHLVKAQKAWAAAGMQKSTGKTFIEAHREAQDAYNALGPKSQAQFKAVAEYLTAMRQRERDNLLAFIESIAESESDLRKSLMARFNASFDGIKGVYFPLSRYGDFILKFTQADGREYVEHYATIAERDLDKARFIKQGVDPSTITESKKSDTVRGETVIPPALMKQIADAVEKKYLAGVNANDEAAQTAAREAANETISDINQTFYRWLPDTAALKNSIHRKNVLGADPDMLRSAMGYVQRHAGAIARNEVGKKIEAELQSFASDNKELEAQGGQDTTLRGQLLDNMRKWYQATKSTHVGPIASLFGRFSTAYYMTSPSTMLVQMTQLPALTLPNLAVRFKSWSGASAALTKAAADAFSPKFSKEAMYGDAKVNQTYEDIHRVVGEKDVTRPAGTAIGDDWYTPEQKLALINKLSPAQKELLALREAMALNLLDISAVHEAWDVAQGKQETVAGKIFKYAMMPMQMGELGSRKAAILAAYRMATARKMDFNAAMEQAGKVVDETLYNYAKEDKGWAMQGSAARILTTFQTYRIKTGLRMALLLKEAIKGETPEIKQAAQREFLGVMGMSALLAGTQGMLLSSTVFALANLVFGSDDEPYDAELEFTNWLKGNLGEKGGTAAAYGLPTLLGANLSRRIGLGDLYGAQSEPPPGLHGADLAAWWAGSLLGPTFSVAQSWFKGYDEFTKGNYMKALEASTPKPIKDALKAVRVAGDGLKDGQGKKLLADDKIGPDDVVMLALGFNPTEIASAQNASFTMRKLSTQVSERRGKLIKDAADAVLSGEDTTPAMQAIKQFNAKMPIAGIKGSDIRTVLRKQMLGEFGATGKRERLLANQYEVPIYKP